MVYFIRVRLVGDDSSALYERDLRLDVLEPIARRVLARGVGRGPIMDDAAVQAVLTPMIDLTSIRHDAEAADDWALAARTELRWLRVFLHQGYEIGAPVQRLALSIRARTQGGKLERRFGVSLGPRAFDPWYEPALALLRSAGVLKPRRPVRREIALCEGPRSGDQERFPLLDEAALGMGGEVESYDLQALPQSPMPRVRTECRALPDVQAGLPVVVLRHKTLQELERAARASLGREIGGLLVGDACRLTGCDRVLVKIQTHVPASAAVSDLCRMSFSHEDNLRFTEAMRTRYRKHRTLGWYHTHPEAPFLSEADRSFHRSTWQAPWHVALVLGYGGQVKLFFCWGGDELIPLPGFYTY